MTVMILQDFIVFLIVFMAAAVALSIQLDRRQTGDRAGLAECCWLLVPSQQSHDKLSQKIHWSQLFLIDMFFII